MISKREEIVAELDKTLLPLCKQGLTLADIGKQMGITRERVRQKIKYAGYKEIWLESKPNRPPKPRRRLKPPDPCVVCGKDNMIGSKYCEEHQDHKRQTFEYGKDHICPICQWPTSPKNRVNGYCKKCYMYHVNVGVCKRCNKERLLTSYKVCYSCYGTIKNRAVKNYMPENWTAVVNFELEKTIFDELYPKYGNTKEQYERKVTCKRCKKRKVHVAKGLCASCYQKRRKKTKR